MALRGIQEYIARDANNIARVLLASRAIYSSIPEKEPSNIIIIIYIMLYWALCVILLSYDCE